MPVISAAVEGLVDEAVVSRLVAHVGFELGSIYGRRGRSHLLARAPSYNYAARHTPWLVLADLDMDVCAPSLVARVVQVPAALMRFRVAVREVETWLMGDRERLASFLSIPTAAIAIDPETLVDPKRSMLELAGRSRSTAVKRRMLRPSGASFGAGPAYTASLIEFVTRHWRPEVAATNVDSLNRAIVALESLMEQT